MATAFRAVVMLLTLVALPAAWVYYGPLPPAAMGVVERTVASAKQSLGWEETAPTAVWMAETPKSAPRFDPLVVEATHALDQQAAAERTALPLPPITYDSHFALASATVPVAPVADPLPISPELARQLEPHLSLLRSLDAADYTLEDWGGEGHLYRFRCAIALGENRDHTRQFEAIDADPLRAVHQVVGEVTSWQNALQLGGVSRWQ